MNTRECEHFGALLRRLRLTAGLTQAALAERAGLSERAVNDLERDPKRLPRLDSVTQLAAALGLPPDVRAQLLAAARPHAAAQDQASPPRRESAPEQAGDRPDSSARAWQLSITPLPVDPTPFVGRASEIAAVRARLQEPGARLLTLTGPGGIGKTRLALRVADSLRGQFADGVCFVPLAALADPGLVLPAIAIALGIPESTHQALSQRLGEALGARHLLLVLDNFEQVIPASVQIEHLLAACPRLTVLGTSRAALRLAREREYAVPPLAVPDLAQLPALEDLRACDSVALLAQCARVVIADFALNQANAQPVAAICARLEGIPLAIQLAAARLKLLPPAALLARLDQQLALLVGGPYDAPARQRSLRATLDWSYELLTPPQQTLFRRLAVFAGGWSLDAAEGICAGESMRGVALLDVLGDLVAHSLVVVEHQDGTARYRFLEPIRQYAQEKLMDAGEESVVRQRHLMWYLGLAEQIDAQAWFMAPPRAVPFLRAEADNFRAALTWSRHDVNGPTRMRFGAALMSLWNLTPAEGRAVLRDALESQDAAAPASAHAHALMRDALEPHEAVDQTSARAHALMVVADLAGMQTDLADSIPMLEEALAIFREVGDQRNVARTLTLLVRAHHWIGNPVEYSAAREETLRICHDSGNLRAVAETLYFWADLEMDHGEYSQARRELEACATLCRQLDDTLLLAHPLVSLARVACAEGNIPQARAYAEQGLTLRRDVAPPWLIATSLASLGEVERCAGHNGRAAEVFEEALALFERHDTPSGAAWVHHNLGQIALGVGDSQRAAVLLTEALVARHRHRYANGMATELAAIAGVIVMSGNLAQAAQLFGASQTLLESSRTVLVPADMIAHERHIATVRQRMEPWAFDDAWDAGCALTLRQAVEMALNEMALRASSLRL